MSSSASEGLLFFALVINGGLAGGIYALIALAFVLVYKASRMINFALGEWIMFGSLLASTGSNAIGLDSSSGNRRQKEFNNFRAKVRRQGDRRSVEWLCRRDGRRLRACWPACDGCQGSGESDCWRAGRRAVCERTGRAGRPEPLLG